MQTNKQDNYNQDKQQTLKQSQLGGVRGFILRNRFIVKCFSVFIAIIAVSFLSIVGLLRFYFLPHIDHFRPEIEAIVSRSLNHDVHIGHMVGEMSGLDPVIGLNDLQIVDEQGQTSLKLENLTATVSWQSLVSFNVRLVDLQIQQPDVAIVKDVDGVLYIAGIRIDPNKPTDPTIGDWLVQQGQITIRDGRLHWLDKTRKNASLEINNIDFSMQNEGRDHQVTLEGSFSGASGGKMKIAADMTHPVFCEHESDVTQWSGDLSADIEQLDISRISELLSLPISVKEGKVSAQIQASLDSGVIAQLQATTSAEHLVMKLGQHVPELFLKQFKADLHVENISDNDEKPQYTYSINNLSLQTQKEEKLTDADFTLSSQPDKELTTAGRLDIEHVNLAQLQSFLTYVPMRADFQNAVNRFAVNGELSQSYLQWNVDEDRPLHYQAQIKFKNIGLKDLKEKNGWGLRGLSGQLMAQDDKGQLLLESNSSAVLTPLYPQKPLQFDAINADLAWENENNGLTVKIHSFDAQQRIFKFTASGQYHRYKNGDPLGNLNVIIKTENLPLKSVRNYVPVQAPQALYQWLTTALKDGVSPKGEVKINGNLSDFPFDKKSNGEFTVRASIHKGRMNYTPQSYDSKRKESLWPDLENIQGEFRMDGYRLSVHADSAMTQNVPLKNVDVIVENVAKNPRLDITGQAVGNMQRMMGFIVHSPVAQWISHFTDDAKTTGVANVDLELHLPLEKIETATVLGKVKFNNNNIVLFEDLPVLSNTRGELQFTEKGFSIDKLNANFLHEPVSISGGTQKNGQFVVTANGILSAQGVKKTYTSGPLGKIVSFASGQSPYSVTVTNGKIQIHSSLKGFGIHLPAPLYKVAQTTLPLTVSLKDLPSQGKFKFDELKIALGDNMSAHYLRRKQGKGPWHVVRGGIGINRLPTVQEKLAIALDAEQIDVKQWYSFLSSFSSGTTTKKSKASTAQSPLLGYLMPQYVDIVGNDINVYGTHLTNARFKGIQNDNVWHFDVNSQELSGQFSWYEQSKKYPYGKIVTSLKKLDLKTQTKGLSAGSAALTFSKLPAFDVAISDATFNGLHIGRIFLQTELIKENGTTLWKIAHLDVENDDVNIAAKGNWLPFDGGKGSTQMSVHMDILNAGNILERFGLKDAVRNGHGELNAELYWDGSPFAPDIASINGNLNLKLLKGMFLKADPGIGRILSAISFQSLSNRLALDFRDLLMKGLAFDEINMQANIDQGVLYSDNFKMNGVTAAILIDGKLDLSQQTQNLNVIIIPEINAGGASIAVGFINPIVGVGTFLAQMFLRAPLMQQFTYIYEVDGTWNAPHIQQKKTDNILSKLKQWGINQ